MIQHYWTVLIKKSYTDELSKALVLGEVLENVRLNIPLNMKENFEQELISKKFVTLPFDFEILTFLGSDEPDQNAKLILELELPNGEINQLMTVDVATGATGKCRNCFRSNGLFVGGSGVNKFRVYDVTDGKRKKLAEIPLGIDVQFV